MGALLVVAWLVGVIDRVPRKRQTVGYGPARPPPAADQRLARWLVVGLELRFGSLEPFEALVGRRAVFLDQCPVVLRQLPEVGQCVNSVLIAEGLQYVLGLSVSKQNVVHTALLKEKS